MVCCISLMFGCCSFFKIVKCVWKCGPKRRFISERTEKVYLIWNAKKVGNNRKWNENTLSVFSFRLWLGIFPRILKNRERGREQQQQKCTDFLFVWVSPSGLTKWIRDPLLYHIHCTHLIVLIHHLGTYRLYVYCIQFVRIRVPNMTHIYDTNMFSTFQQTFLPLMTSDIYIDIELFAF